MGFISLETYKKYKWIVEYFPVVLIGIFVAEVELDTCIFHTSCQVFITIVSLITFFLIALNFQNSKASKTVALITAIIIWFVLIYGKQKYVTRVI